MIRELVVISGKGGTGKTSLVGSLAHIVNNKVMVDCDVDAADLHLILKGKKVTGSSFTGGKIAGILPSKCTSCGICLDYCRFDAIMDPGDDQPFVIDNYACEGCGVCAHFCPEQAIEMNDVQSGEWYISETRYGRLVHARLGIAQANSGKLVSLLRRTARVLAEEKKNDYIIIDGSPGIGCPVIASLTGVDYVLIVTEPSVSAIHDMERLLELIEHFGINSGICINKYDINAKKTSRIEEIAGKRSLKILAKLPYNPGVTEAQVAGVPYTEYARGEEAEIYYRLWDRLKLDMSRSDRNDKTTKSIQLG